ncbi:PHP domain protein [Melioribacter roseus P3M-2]|uniref:PHP domain protein n=1 Tax=Melioribacter roseus (strain DSM 23840 / JCM 17771 / VKM B-2668 / P3M-2) TaxID=1191523 RepID=I6YY96_MELRP|nr:CehA/McbA family metallohydrolase [Melioribacter roseus]AFN75517.1 PHP domain protein [Melioribacter roseus P3M-2]
MYEYTGAIHIHSNFSDGSGTVEEIASFAGEAGLDYIIITDHNTLRALHEGYEGWYDKTLVLVGCEINDKENKNHLLAIGINEAYSTRLSAKEYVKLVKDAGGIGIIAHPHEKRNSMEKHPPYPWTEWDTDDFTGIEIWNHMSEWMEGLTEENKYNYFVHPLKSISVPPQETIEVWDKLNLKRKVVGVGGVDAHAHKVNLLGFFEVEVFPYKVLFKSIRTHVLTDEPLEPSKSVYENKNIVLNALKEGRCFVSNFYRGDAKGFEFYALKENRKYFMGEALDFSGNVKINVRVPGKPARVKIIRNGEICESVDTAELSMPVDKPGVYRAEVFIGHHGWIFSNHIRIGI